MNVYYTTKVEGRALNRLSGSEKYAAQGRWHNATTNPTVTYRGVEPMLNLKYHSADNGNCRVYYKADKRFYCWQLQTRDQFELLSCTRDGEPNSPIRTDIDIATESPQGSEPIETELRAFLGADNNSSQQPL